MSLNDAIKVVTALNTVFQQMRVAGNRQRTIESYKYIFNQFVEVNDCLRYFGRFYLSLFRHIGCLITNKTESVKIIKSGIK